MTSNMSGTGTPDASRFVAPLGKRVAKAAPCTPRAQGMVRRPDCSPFTPATVRCSLSTSGRCDCFRAIPLQRNYSLKCSCLAPLFGRPMRATAQPQKAWPARPRGHLEPITGLLRLSFDPMVDGNLHGNDPTLADEPRRPGGAPDRVPLGRGVRARLGAPRQRRL